MLLRLQTKPNANGNTKQAEIDTDKKTVKRGYFLFISPTAKGLTTEQLQSICDEAKNNGFKEV